MMMSSDDPKPLDTLIAEVDAAVAQMTPGPYWKDGRRVHHSDETRGPAVADCALTHGMGVAGEEDVNNAAGLVALRNAWPRVSAELRDLLIDKALQGGRVLSQLHRENDALGAEVAQLRAERDQAVANTERLEREGTGIDHGEHITEFSAGMEGVAYILRGYHETHAAQKQEVRQLRAYIAAAETTRCHGDWPCEAGTALASWEPAIKHVETVETERDQLRATLAEARAEIATLTGQRDWLREALRHVIPFLDPDQIPRVVQVADRVLAAVPREDLRAGDGAEVVHGQLRLPRDLVCIVGRGAQDPEGARL